MPQVGLTNWRELLAFIVVFGGKIPAMIALRPPVLYPIYEIMATSGLGLLLEVANLSFDFFGMVLAFGAFLLLRAALDGTPEIVALSERRHALTTTGSEIGAAGCSVAVRFLAVTVSSRVLGELYLWAPESWFTPETVDATVNWFLFCSDVLVTTICFCVFIGLRRNFSSEELFALGDA